jgi:toxin ParE1/3/4
MHYEVVLSNQAQFDIDKAFVYYFENANHLVANSFLEDVDIGIDMLSLNPHYQQFKGNVRTMSLNVFPYLLFFEIFEDSKIVRVLSVFHTSQNPIKYP